MVRTLTLGILVLVMSLFVGTTFVNAQTASPSPTTAPSPTASPTPTTTDSTTPGAPRTGFGS